LDKKKYEVIIRKDPAFDERIYLFATICHQSLKNPQAAYEMLLKGLPHFPESIEILHLKGKLETELKCLKVAEKTFKKLTRLSPDSGEVMMAYCRSLSLNKKYIKCIRYLEIAKRKFTEFENECLLSIVSCHIHQGNIEQARTILSSVLLKGGKQFGKKFGFSKT
jgi:tetratricopeptide (TPR) repeat protein